MPSRDTQGPNLICEKLTTWIDNIREIEGAVIVEEGANLWRAEEHEDESTIETLSRG